MISIYEQEEVLNFIHRRFLTDCDWCTGNCYYFALILQARFPLLDIVYLPVDGHFMVYDRCGKVFYDFNGKHIFLDNTPFYIWPNLKYDDPKLYDRLIKNCIE